MLEIEPPKKSFWMGSKSWVVVLTALSIWASLSVLIYYNIKGTSNSFIGNTIYTGKVLPDERILCENKPYSDDDLDTAALNVLFPKLVWEHDIHTDGQLKAARDQLASIRTWTNALPNAKIKAAYLYWINSYSSEYDKLEEHFKHPAAVSTDDEQNERERQEKEARAEALKECLPKPPNSN